MAADDRTGGGAAGEGRLGDGGSEREGLYRSLVAHSSDVVMVLGADGRFRYLNPAVEKWLGHRPAELLGQDVFGRVHPDDRGRAAAAFTALLSDPEPRPPIEVRMLHGDGSWRAFEVMGANLLSDPAVRGIVVNARDVTERKEAEEALEESHGLLRAVMEGTTDAVFVKDRRGRYLTINRAGAEVLGRSPEEVIGKDDAELFGPEDARRIAEEDREVMASGESRTSEDAKEAADGVERTYLVTRGPYRDHRGEVAGVFGVSRDITGRKEMEESLQHQALHDALTGLPNRALFEDRLRQGLRRAERRGSEVAVLFVDLDDFKVVNDSLGHGAGDELLVAAAGRMRGLLRPGDTAARLGGDEFAFLLEDAGADVAVRVAERVLEELRAPFSVGGRRLFVSASVGVTVGGGAGGKRPADLLREADLAMYRAKRSGKAGHAVFEEGMDAGALERLEIEHGLRRALERGEFVVRYQPKVSLGSGEITCMEALVRWEHPERGTLGPELFLPVAEEAGLSIPLGQRVLREACREARGWQERFPKDPPLSVSVNLSARSFRRPDLDEDVGEALLDSGLDPRGLVLEVTENAAAGDPRTTLGALRRLKALGVRIAVDDFGTGHSSLSNLKRFPVDYLKVDRSFVAGLGRNPEDGGLARAVIELAHILGLEAVAEGVETGEQLALLREMGCELAQGFHFWGPLTAEEAGELLAAHGRP